MRCVLWPRPLDKSCVLSLQLSPLKMPHSRGAIQPACVSTVHHVMYPVKYSGSE